MALGSVAPKRGSGKIAEASAGQACQGGPDEALDVGPAGSVDAVARDRLGLGSEEVLVFHGPDERGVYLGVIVDEVGQAQFLAVGALVEPGPAEADMLGRQRDAPVEVMTVQPAQGAGLHSGSALGDQPDPAAEQTYQAGDGLHGPGHLRSGE